MGYRFVHSFTDRHGKVRHYFRRAGVPRIALPAPNSPEFRAAYDAALGKQRRDTGLALPPFQIRDNRKRTKLSIERQRARGSTAGVYLLLQGDRIVYVGSSEDMPTRVVAHRSNGRQFDRAYYISVPGAKDRARLEAILIATLRPEQNRAGMRNLLGQTIASSLPNGAQAIEL